MGDYNVDPTTTGWWEAEGDEAASTAYNSVLRIANYQRTLDNLRVNCAALYQNVNPPSNPHGSSLSMKSLVDAYSGRQVPVLNVVASVIDTVTALVAKGRPRIRFLTSGGDDDAKDRAQSLTKFLDCNFVESKLYDEGVRAFIDACVFGTGAVKYFVDDKKKTVKCERVPVIELFVDADDASYGDPSVLYQRKIVPKRLLKKQFPEFANQIDAATGEGSPIEAHKAIAVIESWLLDRSGDGEGKHIICIDGCMLHEEEWEHEWFPFTFIHWKKPMVGFWGQPLAGELRPLQYQIDKILMQIRRAGHMMAAPKWFVDSLSRVNEADLNDETAGIVRYSGTAPQREAMSHVLPGDVYQYVWQLYGKGFEIAGVSQMQAAGRKEEGIKSGIAIRESQDVQTTRFMIIQTAYEEMFVDAAKIIIDLMRSIEGATAKVIHEDSFINNVEWKDIDLEKDKYVMRAMPTNLLSTTPAGKLNDVQDMMEAGLISKEDALELLQFPDVEAQVGQVLASKRAARAQIDRILKTMKYESPRQFMDLNQAIVVASAKYNMIIATEEPDESKLDLLDQYISQCKELMPPPPPPPPQGQSAQ
jgi:hypothetical protein